MGHILHRPLLCACAGFALGIGAWGMGGHSLILVFACAALGLGLMLAPRPLVVTAGIVLAGMALGAARLSLFQTRAPTDVSRWADGPAPVLVTGMVGSDPEQHAGHTSFTLRAESVESHGRLWAAVGECVVTLPGTDALADYGDRVTLDGQLQTPPQATNPGTFSWRDALARRGIYAWLSLRRPQSLQNRGPVQSNPILRFAWHVRHAVLRGIRGSLPAGQSAVLGGILIGQRADLPPDLLDDFVRTGTVHILASAGLHVGILAFCLLGMCRALTLPRKLSALLVMGMLALYALVCGGRPSVTRAVVVAVVYLGASLCERAPDGPTTLAAAALLILALQPAALGESGFQLSFLTVLTLAALMPVWNAFWHPRAARLPAPGVVRKTVVFALEMCGLALIAQTGALPIVARDYNQVSLLSVPANLLVVPMLFLVIPLGFAGALVGLAWHGASAALLWPCHWGLVWIVWAMRACAAPPWASLAIASPAPSLVAAYYVVLGGCALGLRRVCPAPDLASEPLEPAPAQ